jgi:hypothetical protein
MRRALAVTGCLVLYVLCLACFFGLFLLPWDLIRWP